MYCLACVQKLYSLPDYPLSRDGTRLPLSSGLSIIKNIANHHVDYYEFDSDERYAAQLGVVSNAVGFLLQEFKHTGIPNFVNRKESVPHSVHDFYTSTTIAKVLAFILNSSWAKDFLSINWYLFSGQDASSSPEVPINALAYAIYAVCLLLHIRSVSELEICYRSISL